MGEIKSVGVAGYEYMEITVDSAKLSVYLDAYESFGWRSAGKAAPRETMGKTTAMLKRDGKTLNKMELALLQRDFEACMDDIASFENKKIKNAARASLATGIAGAALLAGCVFAAVVNPPLTWLCVLLGIPGVIGCILPVRLNKILIKRGSASLKPLIDKKYDEIHKLCKKGGSLL